jgi:hypothetical protein
VALVNFPSFRNRSSPLLVPSRYQALRQQDGLRLLAYQQHLAFYEGQHYKTPRRGRSNLVANYARTIVDKGVAFLVGRGLGFAVEPTRPRRTGARGLPVLATGGGPPDADDERAQAAEALLYDVADSCDLDVVDLQCALNAAVLGDAVYKVFWDAARRQVRVVAVDPGGFFATWRPDDVATLERVDVAYGLTADQALQVYGVRADPRTGAEVVESWTPTEYRVEVARQVVRNGPNPYSVIPFVHVANEPAPGSFWGRSDLADVVPLNRELDERFSDQADVIRFHADPPIIFRGVEDHDSLTVGPGTVWDVPRDADVKLLEWQGQPAAVQDHINQVLRALYETAETPRTAFGDSGRLLSGVALETELRPLIQKTQRKRLRWSAALRQRTRLIWAVAEAVGAAPPGSFAGLRPRVIWPSMMPSDDAQEVRNNVQLVAAGLRSRRTAMDLLGTEAPESELQRVQEEMNTIGPAQSPTPNGGTHA